MKQDNTPRKKSRWAVLGINILLMVAIAAGLGWLALEWLDVWTGHGKELTVPDVKGMSYSSAATRLESDGFIVEIADSVYDNRVGPGVVVDQNPRRNTKVKPGRLIYLTINAFTPKSVTLPRLTDMSARQARAILAGLGIKNVTEQPVISEFKDLVLGARCNGRRVTAGARVPVTASVVLEVGDGMETLEDNPDSTVTAPTEPVERLDLH